MNKEQRKAFWANYKPNTKTETASNKPADGFDLLNTKLALNGQRGVLFQNKGMSRPSRRKDLLATPKILNNRANPTKRRRVLEKMAYFAMTKYIPVLQRQNPQTY